MGRREAFALMAGRCSAAEAESLRRVRDETRLVRFPCDRIPTATDQKIQVAAGVGLQHVLEV